MRMFGVAVGEARRSACAMGLGACRVERADRDECRRRRAADAGIAMDHHRRRSLPALDEADEPFDVLARRVDVAVARLDDVMELQPQMIAARDARRQHQVVLVPEQRTTWRHRVLPRCRAVATASTHGSSHHPEVAEPRTGQLRRASRSARKATLGGLRRPPGEISFSTVAGKAGRGPKKRRASVTPKPASTVASRKAAPWSAVLMIATMSAGSAGGKPIAGGSRRAAGAPPPCRSRR